MITIPAGYLDLGTSIMHVAQIRQYTSDIERFKLHLPLMLALDGVEPRTPEAYAIYDQAGDIRALALSLQELGDLNIAEGNKLKQIAAERGGVK